MQLSGPSTSPLLAQVMFERASGESYLFIVHRATFVQYRLHLRAVAEAAAQVVGGCRGRRLEGCG